MLVYKLIKLFDVDTHNRCFYNLEKERDIDSEFIRQWSFKDIKIEFREGNNNDGNFLLLDIIFNDDYLN